MRAITSRQLAARVSLLTVTLIINTASAAIVSAPSYNAPSTISNFIRTSLEHQPILLAAQADIAAAKANFQASTQAIYNPELILDYENSSVTTQKIGVSQTLDRGDQQGSRTAVAKVQLQVITTNYTIAAHSFVAKVLAGLATKQTAEQLARLSVETLQLMQTFKQVAEQRHQAGDLNQVDLNLARLAYNQALMEHAKALSSETEAQERLRAIVGNFPTDLPILPEQLPEPILQDDLEPFLMSLPNIYSKMAEVQSNRQQIALRKSEQAWDPTISVTAGSEGNDNLIGLNFSIPLNVRNNFSAEVDVAYQNMIASEQRAQQSYRDTRASLIATTERYRNLLNAWNNWRENSRDSVNQQLILVKQLWDVGDISAADYLLQLKQALETQAIGLELRNQLWQVAFDWMKLTSSVDKWLNMNIDFQEKN